MQVLVTPPTVSLSKAMALALPLDYKVGIYFIIKQRIEVAFEIVIKYKSIPKALFIKDAEQIWRPPSPHLESPS